MFQRFIVSARAVRQRVLSFCLTVAVLTIGLAGQVMAQTTGTTGNSFPDLAEPISITEVGTKVVAFLAVGLGVVAAIMLGLVLIRKLLRWIGRGV